MYPVPNPKPEALSSPAPPPAPSSHLLPSSPPAASPHKTDTSASRASSPRAATLFHATLPPTPHLTYKSLQAGALRPSACRPPSRSWQVARAARFKPPCPTLSMRVRLEPHAPLRRPTRVEPCQFAFRLTRGNPPVSLNPPASPDSIRTPCHSTFRPTRCNPPS